MTNDDRLNRMENQIIELNLAVSTLIGIAEQHQRNFEVLATEIRDLRSDFLEVQTEIRGLQTENRRILDEMQRRRDEGDSQN